MAADLVGAGEGDDLRHRVLEERVADLGDVRDDDVQQSAGETGVLEDLREQRATDDRGVLVRLEDHTVAERQRRGDGLQRQQEGEVEGADDPDHAHRHPVEPVLLAVHRGGDDLPLGAQGQLDRLTQELAGQVQFEPRLEPGATELCDDRLGDLLRALLDQAQGTLEHQPPGVGVDLGPLLLRTLGGTVGLVHLLDRGHGYGSEFVPVVGIEVDDVPGPATGPPLAINVLKRQIGE
jgi:hypothetical protein